MGGGDGHGLGGIIETPDPDCRSLRYYRFQARIQASTVGLREFSDHVRFYWCTPKALQVLSPADFA